MSLIGTANKAFLPDGWKLTKLGDVCEIIAGQSPPGSTYRDSPGGLPFFQGKTDFGDMHPVARVWCVEPTKIAVPGDILMSVRAPVGPTNVADVECCIGRGLAAIRCGKKVDRDFILNSLKHFELVLTGKGSGSTFEAINRDIIETFEIPLPPLPEQRRISGILNEHKAAVDKARVATETRLEAAKALPEAFLQKIFPQQGRKLPEGWRWIRLNDIGPLVDGDWILNSDYAENGVRLLQLGDVGCGRYIGKSSRFISEQRASELRCTILKPGDVLISRMPDPIGRACILPNLGYPCITAVDVSIWRVDIGRVVPEVVVAYLNTTDWYNSVLKLSTGATRPRISRLKLQEMRIPLPSFPEQQRLAGIIRDNFVVVDKLAAAIETEREALTKMPSSLLRQVFSGEI